MKNGVKRILQRFPPGSSWNPGKTASRRRKNLVNSRIFAVAIQKNGWIIEIHNPIGTTRGTLLWHAIEHTLAHPPKEPKVTATVRAGARVGSAPGFWLIRKTDDKGKVVGIELREVLAQSAANGQNFYRYRKGDKKGRDRLLDACRLTADKEAKAFSLKDFETKLLDGKELEAALTPHPAPSVIAGVTNALAQPKDKGKGK